MLESPERFVKNEKRDRNERTRIDQRGQHSRTLISVGLARVGRTRLEVNRHQGKQQSEKVGEIVSRLGEQSQLMGPHTSHDQQHYVGQGDSQRNPQNPRGTARAVDVNVHDSSLRAAGRGFKRLGGEWGQSAIWGCYVNYGSPVGRCNIPS